MKNIRTRVVAAAGLSLLISAGALAQATPPPSQNKGKPAAGARPARRVSGRTLTSAELPPVSLKFDKAFKYAGTQSFVLYDVANAEQHFFVDADREGRIRRLYWVQFEGYLPSNNHRYNYKRTRVVNHGGLEFVADASPRKITAASRAERPDSDGSRAHAFLEGKGFRLAGGEVLSQRLVTMVDESNRAELMIIYIEDLAGTGLTAAELSPGGSAAARWGEVSEALLGRALKGFQISRR